MPQPSSDKAGSERAPERPIPVADQGTPNALTLSGIALGCLRGLPGQWAFAGIGADAYVMCRQETHLGGAIAGAKKWLRFGCTDGLGWVYEREAAELEADPPAAAPRESRDATLARNELMLLIPDESYALFWSFDRAHFLETKRAVEAGELAFEQVAGACMFTFAMLQAQPLDGFELMPWLKDEKYLDQTQCELLALHLLTLECGYVREKSAKGRGPIALLDVTPQPLRMLQRAEFLHWYAQRAAERSGPHLAALQRAGSLIAACETGAPDAVMEGELDKLAKRGTPEREVLEKYRVYAWKCAVAEVRSQEFRRSLPTSLKEVSAKDWRPDLAWEEMARRIRLHSTSSASGAAEHPGLHDSIQNVREPELSRLRVRVMLDVAGLSLVQGYFDVYALGKELKEKPFAAGGALLGPMLAVFEREWEATLDGELPKRAAALLRKAPYQAFVVALLQCTGELNGDSDKHPDHRLALLERYLDACALTKTSWWLDVHNASPKEWMRIAALLKWTGEVLKGKAKLSSLLQPRLAAYALVELDAVQQLYQTLLRHELALAGTPIDLELHRVQRDVAPFQARVSMPAHGELVVTRNTPLPNAAHVEARLRLLQRARNANPAGAGGYRLAPRIRDAITIDTEVPIDLKGLQARVPTLPADLAAFGELLNVVSAVLKISEGLERHAKTTDQLVPAWDVFKGVVAIADSRMSVWRALHPALATSKFFDQAARKLKSTSRVVGGIDGALKLTRGLVLLCSEEGDLEYELRQGRSVRAGMQAAKGMLQVAVGAVTILAALPGTAALAATPIGLLIVVGGNVLCATMDVALDALHGLSTHRELFMKELDKAKREELTFRSFRVTTCVQDAGKRINAVG